MMTSSRLARRAALSCLAGTAAAALAAGTALAYWRTTGSGSGSATVGTPQAVTIATNGTAGTLLRPGGTGDLVITATNPNGYDVQLTGLSLGAVTGCTTPALTLTSPASYLPLTIPHNSSATRVVLAGALTMGASSSNCQNAALDITLVPTLRSLP